MARQAVAQTDLVDGPDLTPCCQSLVSAIGLQPEHFLITLELMLGSAVPAAGPGGIPFGKD